jgi:arylsulfatase A-like enzyme
MSLLTGMYPSRHGVESIVTKLPAHIPLLSSVLSQHGFATATIVNYWLLRRDFGFDRGFDHYSRVEHSQKPEGAASTIISQAVKWLREHSRERFFLFLHFFDPHSDYTALERYKEPFVRPYQGSFTGTSKELVPFSPQVTEDKEIKKALNEDDVNYLADLYAASIRQMDDDLKKFFSFLEEHNLFEQTLLIVTSDHGEEFYEHRGLSHGYTQFQELLNVPLILRGPGVPEGQRVKEIASLVDIMPTTLGLLGIAAPPLQNGIDLSHLWQEGNSQLPQRHIFAEADCRQMTDPDDRRFNIKRAIRHPRYKLHYNLLSTKAQLYDLLNDPQERIDVARRHLSPFKLLFSELEEFMKIHKTGRRLPEPTEKEIETLRSLGYL